MNPLSNVLVTAQFSVPELVVVDVCHGALELKLGTAAFACAPKLKPARAKQETVVKRERDESLIMDLKFYVIDMNSYLRLPYNINGNIKAH